MENNKHILIIGSDSDISQSLIERSKNDNLNFILHKRKKNKENLTQEVIYHDFTSTNVHEFAIKLENRKLDGIVFLIGKTGFNFFKNLDSKDWYDIFDHNVIIPALIVKELYEQLNDDASLIFIGSVLANEGQIGMTHYASAKSALKGLIKSLAKELKHKKIRVNMIEAHLIETKNTRKMTAKLKEEYISKNLSNRIGEPKDLSELIRFLISDKSSYVNASIIELSGGHDY